MNRLLIFIVRSYFWNGPLACQAYQAEVENAVIRTLAVTPN